MDCIVHGVTKSRTRLNEHSKRALSGGGERGGEWGGSQEDSRPGDTPASLKVEQETERKTKVRGELPGTSAEGTGGEVVGPVCCSGEGGEEGLASGRLTNAPLESASREGWEPAEVLAREGPRQLGEFSPATWEDQQEETAWVGTGEVGAHSSPWDGKR